MTAAIVRGHPLLIGCDFSSSPSRRKPIVVALGRLQTSRLESISCGTPAPNGQIELLKTEHFDSLDAFTDWLCTEREPWVGGFDLPFGLPRELVRSLGWPTDWARCMDHFCAQPRAALRECFKAFCDARPAGGKFAHRATDGAAGSSPSMKWVNPPVAWMMHAGVPLLRRAQATLPGLHQGRADRIALEAYPGLLARAVLGARSYKSDDAARQTPERLIARKDLLVALEHGLPILNLALRLSPLQHDALAADARGDRLDAVLCLLQAAWALVQQRRHEGDGRSANGPGWGLPAFDPLEGWIVGA